MLLPLQGDFAGCLFPRALPWAKSFCPFRAFGEEFMIDSPEHLAGFILKNLSIL